MATITVLWIYHQSHAFGGPFNAIQEILRLRDRRRFRMIAMLPGPGPCADVFRREGAAVIYGREHPGERTWRYGAATVSFAAMLARERVDLVYFPDYTTWKPAEILGARLARVPVVLHVRSPHLDATDVDPLLQRATLIIGNSSASLQGFRGHVPDKRLRVIYNCVDTRRFLSGRDIRAEFFGGRPPIVGFVGIFRPEKGIEYFLEAARIIHRERPDVRFLAVGGESAFKNQNWVPRMMNHAKELQVDHVVRFVGQRTDIPDIMRSIDVLAVPSLNEGFGHVIIEANAAGTPVVGFDAGGIPEVIENNVTGFLVPPRDAQALAEGLLRALDDENWRTRVATVAPRRVQERFDPRTQVGLITDAWREAAGRKSRRHTAAGRGFQFLRSWWPARSGSPGTLRSTHASARREHHRSGHTIPRS